MRTIFKGEIVFVRLLLPVVTGIGLALLFTPSPDFYLFLKVLCGFQLLTSMLLLLAYSKYQLYFKKWLPAVVIHSFIITTCYCLTTAALGKTSPHHFSNSAADGLVVTVLSEPKFSGDILRFQSEVNQVLRGRTFKRAEGKLLIALKVEEGELAYGDRLLIPAKYTEVDPPFNPFEFNYKQYLNSQGIYYQAFINQNQVRVLEPNKGNPLISYSQKWRRAMIEYFAAYIKNEEALAVASTLILGYRATLSAEVLSAYSKTGTMHVLSVSGMHVALVMTILINLLWFMNRNRKLKLIQSLLVITLIWFYSMISGFSPSVCRAALMITILIFGKAINRKSNSYNLLAASAVLLLVYNPLFLVDVGFQLSYLAVFGLVYFYPKIYHSIYTKNFILDNIWSYIALSLAAQLSTFPLSMYYFHQFPVYFLFSNLFIVLPVLVIMFSGIAFLALKGFAVAMALNLDPLLQLLAQLLERSIVFTNQGLFYIEKLPYSGITYTNSSLFFYLLAYMLLVAITFTIVRESKNWFYMSGACFLVLTILYSVHQVSIKRMDRIIFYSLRKNTAFVVFSAGKAFVHSDIKQKDNTFNFSVKPSLDAYAESVSTKPEIAQTKLQDGSFFQHGKYKMVIWNNRLNTFTYRRKMKVNAVLLTGNVKIKLDKLSKCLQFDQLIIDGTNKDYRINAWIKEAKELELNYYVLKRNPALIVDLL